MMFKPIFRHLWHKRLFTILNIFGLGIGISACWMIFQIASHEFSYDRDLPGLEQTYRVVTQLTCNGQTAYNAGAAAPLYQGTREELTGWDAQWVSEILDR